MSFRFFSCSCGPSCVRVADLVSLSRPSSLSAFVASLPKSQQRQGHAVQEAVFKSEARRIWDAQCSSLSNPIPPQLSEEEEEANARDAVTFNNKQGNQAGRSQSQSRAGSVMDNDDGYVGGSSQAYAAFSSSSKGGGGRRSPSAMSRGSSMDRDDAMSVGSGRGYGPGKEGGRVLRIKRLVSFIPSFASYVRVTTSRG